MQCLTLGEDRGVLSAAMSADGRRQQRSPASPQFARRCGEEAQHGCQVQGGERLLGLCSLLVPLSWGGGAALSSIDR